MSAAWWMVGALSVLAIAYRYYSAFLAARVLCLDDARKTPAHRFNDGENYHPTHKWVLFGHHFAAITGAGPLIGPVLAAQFGFLPGFLWILVGVVLGGAVHDLVILTASVRRNGRSLAEIAREELGPGLGLLTSVAILFIIVIALAGLGNVVVGALSESPWGVFTVGCSIPIALLMGGHIYGIRKGSVRGIREASAPRGSSCSSSRLIVGKYVADSSSWSESFRLSTCHAHLCHCGVRLCGEHPAGLALALPSRLPFELPQARDDRAPCDRNRRGQPADSRCLR
jgi:carbon starvation protein